MFTLVRCLSGTLVLKITFFSNAEMHLLFNDANCIVDQPKHFIFIFYKIKNKLLGRFHKKKKYCLRARFDI